MSDKKQNSIDWLEQQLKSIIEQGNIEVENLIWQQAKAMHKEEIKTAWLDEATIWDSEKEAEQYYNETFGGDNE